jgi:hypothetical protein
MSALEALKAARAAGVELALLGEDLVLSAAAAPQEALINALSRYRAEIVALLLRRPADFYPSPRAAFVPSLPYLRGNRPAVAPWCGCAVSMPAESVPVRMGSRQRAHGNRLSVTSGPSRQLNRI